MDHELKRVINATPLLRPKKKKEKKKVRALEPESPTFEILKLPTLSGDLEQV